MQIEIIYQDQNLIAVNKPAGLLVHPDQTDDPASADLVTALKKQTGQNYFGIHQRLDREVSGVILFALTREVNPTLARSFEGREVIKEYLAIVSGKPNPHKGIITAQLSRQPDKNGRYLTVKSGGVAATTRYELQTTTKDNRFSLLRLQLETGRTHQLRAHLAHIGCPIVGDTLYEGRQFPRLLLHATRLELKHPVSGENLELIAPPPALFNRIAENLAEFDLSEKPAQAGLKALLPKSAQKGLVELLELAESRRQPLADDRDNTAYRLVNAKADGLPDFTLDRFGKVLVLSFYDPTIDQNSPLVSALKEAIGQIWQGYSLYVKYRPRTAARLSEPEIALIAPPFPLSGTAIAEISVKENGLNYLIRPGQGLSVGLFLDMREMRARVQAWAEAKTVLNCFSYTCAFGVAATAGGATRVLNLDASRGVLDWGKENYLANGFKPDDYDFLEGDVFDWLGRFGRKGQQFDMLILDPPSYSTTKKTRFAADKNYGDLIKLAAPLVAKGGILIAASNHAGLDKRTFRRMVNEGITAAKRTVTNLTPYHEPELDFPHAPAKEGYLKLLVCHIIPSPPE
jgi:23S rRNA (cytosine1962-C5)-methyltransferase